MLGKYNFELISQIPTNIYRPSEFTFFKKNLKNVLYIFLSQSGETADTAAAIAANVATRAVIYPTALIVAIGKSWNKRVTVSPFDPATSSPTPLTTIAIGNAAYTHNNIPNKLPIIAVPSPIPPVHIIDRDAITEQSQVTKAQTLKKSPAQLDKFPSESFIQAFQQFHGNIPLTSLGRSIKRLGDVIFSLIVPRKKN